MIPVQYSKIQNSFFIIIFNLGFNNADVNRFKSCLLNNVQNEIINIFNKLYNVVNFSMH